MNPLKWRLMGQGPKVDLLKEIVPEQFQRVTTVFERAAADGVEVTQVAPMYQAGSGLTRAALRGGEFRPTFSSGDLVDGVLTALGGSDRTLVYAYHGDLDMTGHVRGPGSQAWALELAHIDLTIRAIAERLPAGAALIVTADHGMVHVETPVDFDREPLLQAGVRGLGGEPRARHVYTEPGAAPDVAAAWRDRLGADFTVLTRGEVTGEGWFGPTVGPEAAPRIGDVVVVPTGTSAITRSGAEPLQSNLVGHHGSLTPAEMIVPLYVIR